MSLTIFENQTTNLIVEAKTPSNGIIQVNIAGVLDGADVITSFFDNFGNKIPIADCSWRASKGDLLDVSDGGTKYVQETTFRFEIINAGGSTDISLSVTHESGNIVKV